MELLCIQTHSQGAVQAGYFYPLIRESKDQSDACKCDEDCYDVGVEKRYEIPTTVVGIAAVYGRKYRCVACGDICVLSGTWWISKELFGAIATEEEYEKLSLTKKRELTEL
jgi:hypothetical protein